MNAIRSMLRTSIVVGRRSYTNSMEGPVHTWITMFKGTTRPVDNALVPNMYKYSVKEAWFSDPSTYPLFAILTFVTSFIIGMAVNTCERNKDVKFLSIENKHKVIRDWGNKHSEPLAYVIGKHPVGFHAEDYKKLHHEGLGIDHEEWLKSKQDKSKK